MIGFGFVLRPARVGWGALARFGTVWRAPARGGERHKTNAKELKSGEDEGKLPEWQVALFCAFFEVAGCGRFRRVVAGLGARVWV